MLGRDVLVEHRPQGVVAARSGGGIRREALRQWLWEKAEAWGMKQTPGAMSRALDAYGYGDDPAVALERMVDGETETVILHERGEFAAGRLLGPEWQDMLAGFSSRRPELLARAVRDNLADCLSTLPALMADGKHASLHFWFASFEGMRRELFPWLVAAYDAWQARGDAVPLADAVAAGCEHWQQTAETLLAGYRAGAVAMTEVAPLSGPAA
jgi:hypothetical protein